jgi:hypothetical protein
MISFKTILNEEVNLYQGDAILKNTVDTNQKDIFNQLRAVPNVIVVTPVVDDYLASQRDDKIEYALVKIKFISTGNPMEDLQAIKSRAMKGGDGYKRVEGLLSFVIRPKTIIAKSR